MSDQKHRLESSAHFLKTAGEEIQKLETKIVDEPQDGSLESLAIRQQTRVKVVQIAKGLRNMGY